MFFLSKVTIIVPTHSNYIDVCNIFFELFKKNWSDCEYDLIFSISGENKEIENADTIYNGKNVSLPRCIYNASLKKKSDIYICMLGDAFISEKVNSYEIAQLIKEFEELGGEYASLILCKSKKKYTDSNLFFKQIYSKDHYAHSFIAFIASHDFIINNFNSEITDFDFEMNYVMNEGIDGFYYPKHYIVKKNYLHLIPGIEKGRWNRKSFYIIKNKNKDVDLNGRGCFIKYI